MDLLKELAGLKVSSLTHMAVSKFDQILWNMQTLDWWFQSFWLLAVWFSNYQFIESWCVERVGFLAGCIILTLVFNMVLGVPIRLEKTMVSGAFPSQSKAHGTRLDDAEIDLSCKLSGIAMFCWNKGCCTGASQMVMFCWRSSFSYILFGIYYDLLILVEGYIFLVFAMFFLLWCIHWYFFYFGPRPASHSCRLFQSRPNMRMDCIHQRVVIFIS